LRNYRLKVEIFKLEAKITALRSSMSRSTKAANGIKQEGQGSQWDQAGGGLSFLFSQQDTHISVI